MYGWHYNGQVQSFNIALNGCPALPGSVVVGVTMQEIKRAKFPARFFLSLCQGSLRKQYIQRTQQAQGFRKEVDFVEDHRVSFVFLALSGGTAFFCSADEAQLKNEILLPGAYLIK